MKRCMTLLLLSIGLASPALAADRPLDLTIDGRPISRTGSVALFHRNVAFVNLIELVRSFGGLVTLSKSGAAVTLRSHSATFVSDRATATVDAVPMTMPAAAFTAGGVLYVPLEFFVNRIAGGTVRVDAGAATARIAPGADPAPDASASP